MGKLKKLITCSVAISIVLAVLSVGAQDNAFAAGCTFPLSDGPSGTLTSGNFSGQSFENENLSRNNFTDSNFANANLKCVDFGFANLTNADFSGADLSKANLSQANLTGAKLGSANLFGITTYSVIGVPESLPTGWKLMDGRLIGPYANAFADTNQVGMMPSPISISGFNLDGVDLTGVDLWGNGYIQGTPIALPTGWKLINHWLVGPGADLKYANLTNSDLSGANLEYAVLTNANLTNSDLSGANLNYADLQNATMSYVKSGGVNGTPSALPNGWKLIGGYLIGSGADLTGANLNGLDLSSVQSVGIKSGNVTGIPTKLPTGWKLINGYLVYRGANLENANLEGVDFHGLDLNGINLSNANLKDTNFSGADLRHANLSGADLTNSVLTNTTIGCLDAASLEGVVSGNVSISQSPNGRTCTGNLAEHWKLIGGYLIGPKANLRNANLGNLDLSTTTLTSVKSGNITGVPSRLPANWGLFGGYLVGPGASLVDADLSEAYISNVSLENTDFSGAKLDFVDSHNISGTPLNLPLHWVLRGGRLLGPTAQLYALIDGEDLSNLDLSRGLFETIKDTNLDNTDLSSAYLGGMQSSGITGLPRGLPAGWTLDRGFLVGAGANFTDVNLSGMNFENKNLSEVTMTRHGGAQFTYVTIFHGVNLTDARFTGTNLTAASIVDCNIQNADFQDADFTRIYSASLHGTPSHLPTGWTISQGAFVKIQPPHAAPQIPETVPYGSPVVPTIGQWDDSSSISIQWLLDGVLLPGTPLQYLPAVGDIGKQLQVKIIATSPGFADQVLSSNSSRITLGSMAGVNPTLKGQFKVGKLISGATTNWVPGSLISYQWLLNGKLIKGANKSSFKAPSNYRGKKISLRVTQTLTGYTPLSRSSASFILK